MEKTFAKILSANDVGETDAHMGGILVPKGDVELLAFLPKLDPDVFNPSAWIECVTPDGQLLRLRFVYYNNKLHAPTGTRNEYRITWLTKFLRQSPEQSPEIYSRFRERTKAVPIGLRFCQQVPNRLCRRMAGQCASN